MATKIYIVKGTYESYSSVECVIEGVYSSEEKAVARYNLLVDEVKQRIITGELDEMGLECVHEENIVTTNAKGEERKVWYTWVDYGDLGDTYEIEVHWLDDEEPEEPKDIPGFEGIMDDLNAIRVK